MDSDSEVFFFFFFFFVVAFVALLTDLLQQTMAGKMLALERTSKKIHIS